MSFIINILSSRKRCCAAAEGYNACRERLFALEKEGKVLIVEPEDTRGFALTERDVDKINALYQDGYNKTLTRLDEISRFMAGE